MITDLKSGRMTYSAYIYLIIIMIMESMTLTVVVLSNGIVLFVVNKKATRCFCLAEHLITYSMEHSPA